MKQPFFRLAYLLVAVALHAAVLWGFTFGQPAMISDQEGPEKPMEVGLVENAEEVVPPAPESTPEPPAPEPPPPEQTPTPPEPTPPPNAMPEPDAPAEMARPTATPPPKLRSKPTAPRPAVPNPATSSAAPSKAASSTAPTGQPGPGDTAHATWRHRVEPKYPPSARAAKQTGRVLILIDVSPTGKALAARIASSSGIPALDQAALAAARASSYNPRKIAGIPLPDSITVPYTFRLDQR